MMFYKKKKHGFRKQKSTLSAIVEFLHDVYINVNEMKNTYVIYLDLKKAFDSVSHTILLSKLKMIGLDRNSVRWFNSYLSNRKQKTIANNTLSNELYVPYGVPQGSILGPTLFTIYINDLAELIKGNINFYADDTILYSSDSRLLNADLECTYNWCNSNLLTINCKKSQWMNINLTGRKLDNTFFTLGNTLLKRVEEYRYLGVIIDSQLTFQAYRDSLINRVNLKISYFRKIRYYMTQEAALMLYKGTILPIIEYADFVFDFNIKYINRKLQTLQNNALYIVFNQHFLPYDQKDSTETLHRQAKLYRLTHRRWIHMLLFVYNSTSNHALLDVRDIHTRRRDGILFTITKMDHYKAKQDPMRRAMSAWNTLTVQTRNVNTKDQLRICLNSAIVNPYSKVE